MFVLYEPSLDPHLRTIRRTLSQTLLGTLFLRSRRGFYPLLEDCRLCSLLVLVPFSTNSRLKTAEVREENYNSCIRLCVKLQSRYNQICAPDEFTSWPRNTHESNTLKTKSTQRSYTSKTLCFNVCR